MSWNWWANIVIFLSPIFFFREDNMMLHVFKYMHCTRFCPLNSLLAPLALPTTFRLVSLYFYVFHCCILSGGFSNTLCCQPLILPSTSFTVFIPCRVFYLSLMPWLELIVIYSHLLAWPCQQIRLFQACFD